MKPTRRRPDEPSGSGATIWTADDMFTCAAPSDDHDSLHNVASMPTEVTRAKKPRAKSGCRTCKIRKIKCDEAFPACHRCTSTGRACDGYGIWGGGGGARPQKPAVTSSLARAAPCAPVLSTEDCHALDWFRHRTAVKLQGSFFSDFWTSLLFQSSAAEPAVLHAVLALSIVHRDGIVGRDGQSPTGGAATGPSNAALVHYGRAIRCLQPHFSARGRRAHRVALIACIVFTSLDFLRRHFRTAFMHLDSGVRLLESAAYRAEGHHDCVDDWIEEILSRIHLQIGFIRYFHKGTCFRPLPGRGSRVIPQSGVFGSVKHAWQTLEDLIGRAIGMSGEARGLGGGDEAGLREQHGKLEADVRAWHDAYGASEAVLFRRGTVEERKGGGILRAYHAMTAILAATCLCPGDEMVFDAHVGDFASLMHHMHALRAVALGGELPQAPGGAGFDMARSIVDMGCIVPLYYTALKCRDGGVRREAVEFLESTYHREGVWDSTMTARIARRVMEVEEGEGTGGRRYVPACRRLRDVEVSLVGEPVGKLLLMCRQGNDAGAKVCVGEYHLLSEAWSETI